MLIEDKLSKGEIRNLFLFAILFFIPYTFYLAPLIPDDAFIYLTVAKNIVLGNGWSFNPSESVNPCTSFFYLAILLIPTIIGIEGSAALLLIFYICLLVIFILIIFILRSEGRIVTVATLLVTYNLPHFVLSVGMESALVIVLAFCTALLNKRELYNKSISIWKILLIVLCILTRIDCLAFVPIYAISDAYRYGLKKNWIKNYSLLIIILAIGILVQTWLSGSELPNSILVKVQQGQSEKWNFGKSFIDQFISYSSFPILTYSVALFGILFSVLQAKNNKASPIIPFLLFSLAQVIVYAIAKAPTTYFWYYIFGLLSVNLCIVSFLVDLLQYLYRKKGIQLLYFNSYIIAIFIGIVVSLFGSAPVMNVFYIHTLSNSYKSAGEWISENTPHDAKVAATEIGYLGYYSNRYIVDIHTLIHPSKIDSVKNGTVDWWYEGIYPDVIVSHSPPWYGEPENGKNFSKKNYNDFVIRYFLAKSIEGLNIYFKRK